MKRQGIWKRFAAYLLVCFGFGGQVLLAQERITVLERKMLDEDFRLHNLEVDRTGALYFGSFEEIVKLQPDGRRVFRIGAEDYGLRRFADFRVAPGGELIAAGVAMDPQPSAVMTRVLVLSPKGKLLRSFEVSGVTGEKVEPGENGEIFLLGFKSADSPASSGVHEAIYRLSSSGQVLAQIGETELSGAGRSLSRNNRRLAVTGRGIFLLDPASAGVLLHRFSHSGQKLGAKSFIITSVKSHGESAVTRGEPAAATLDYFSSFDPDRFVLSQVTMGDQWQRRMVGQGEQQAAAYYRPSSYTIYVVSWDGMVRTIPAENMGLLRAVGRDGFLYFVKSVRTAGKTRTEVVKAILK
ncbi:MAG TPA: hypothetical protein VNM72_10280 [Blastocatellia bacterium]|nr:hypothetical protein [Blastocatellia bacterium]